MAFDTKHIEKSANP